ncbi:MAG: alpha/beta hydrolase [Deltaproteobacteria bacterium]|nr:alpha/beta hydrolase [Deltaproteobacteria bacterium]
MTPERLPAPSKLWLLLEGRAAGELLTTLALRPLLRRLVRGDGHPVLLLPGFLASDLSTRPLRGFLRGLGYYAHRWNLGRNLGAQGDLEERLSERLDEVFERHQRPVSLVGWSLGGIYARLLANRHPERVRSVISLGSPFAEDVKANNSWRLYEWITKERLDEVSAERLDEVRRTPPVPTTSIFSRTDGVTAWRSALEREGPQAESVEVRGSHLGLGFNPLVLYVIADRLSQGVDDWLPFFRSGIAHPPGISRPPEALLPEAQTREAQTEVAQTEVAQTEDTQSQEAALQEDEPTETSTDGAFSPQDSPLHSLEAIGTLPEAALDASGEVPEEL